jgi:hypothetical protein
MCSGDFTVASYIAFGSIAGGCARKITEGHNLPLSKLVPLQRLSQLPGLGRLACYLHGFE